MFGDGAGPSTPSAHATQNSINVSAQCCITSLVKWVANPSDNTGPHKFILNGNGLVNTCKYICV